MAARIALLLSAVACAEALSSSLESQAWLRKHQNPNVDELDELKGENPEAYAIVKALLTKRSLGLLDPKHPTASFSAAKPTALTPDQQGPEAFAKFSSSAAPVDTADPAEAAYPEAPVHHEHKDFFSWKPSASGADDDAEVQSVLGAVAAVAQSKPAAAAPVTKSLSSEDAVQPVEKPVAAMGQENSYLKGMDFGIKAPVVQATRSTSDNSYLRGSGLVEDEAAPKTEKLTQMGAPKEDFLASFSWNDEQPKPKSHAHHRSSLAVASSSVATEADSSSTQAEAKAKSTKANSLFAWLDGSATKKATAKAVAPATTVQPQNGYMMDLN